MIKLTVDTYTASPALYTFSKTNIIIGSGSSSDLLLQDESIQEIHIEIVEKNEFFIAINRANDPFAVVNGLPFGKKKLSHGDVIQIGPYSIKFEETPIPSQEEPLSPELLDTAQKIPEILEHAMTSSIIRSQKITLFPSGINASHDLQIPEEELTPESFEEDLDIDALLREVELLDFIEYEKKSEQMEPQNLLKEREPAQRLLKHMEIEEDLDERENLLKPVDFPEERKYQWGFWIGVIVALFTLLALILSAIYVHMMEKTEEEEIKAAEGVADVSMALKYAQIYHIKPLKQNWSDPEFLKNSLTSVLPHEYPSLANIDAHGQFTNTPYMLRLYTSSDFSQFLVIAQPAPSMFQWFFPKDAIVVNSRYMEMRKVSDFRTLNRLLVSADNLEGENAQEITQLVKQGKLIPLSFLVSKNREQEFSPPKALAWLRPGAENLIYNAPRYYQFGEAIMERAVSLVEAPGSSYEVSRLKQEMGTIAEMPNMLLYSSNGMQFAMEAQKALAIFVPNIKFMAAYLTFSPKGKMLNSHLLIDDENVELAMRDSIVETSLTLQSSLLSAKPSDPQPEVNLSKESEHPLYFQLAALVSDRQKSLKEVTDPLIQLLSENVHSPTPNFSGKMDALALQYQQAVKNQQDKFINRILELSYEYQEMPASQFMKFVQDSRLDNAFNEMLGIMKLKFRDQTSKPEQIDFLREQILQANNFIELDKYVVEAAALLTIARFPDMGGLIDYQDKIHRDVIQKLNVFLIQPENKKDVFTFGDQDRSALVHSLKAAWINDEAEFGFYLAEFDNLAQQQALNLEKK